MAAVAKKANANEPNIVINELFCNLIARSLFLPCPPGALLENGGEHYYSSLNFNLAGQALPPAPITQIAANFPEICWGVILFDVLVMNPDRHNKNLSFDRTTNVIQIFDHSRAFLPCKSNIDTAIKDNNGKLGFSGHCLKNEISTMNGFDYWTNRIKILPDYVIEESVTEISHIGFPIDKKALTIDFIKSRRDNIDSLITSNIKEFPKLPQPAVVAPKGAPPAGVVPPTAVPQPAPQPGQAR